MDIKFSCIVDTDSRFQVQALIWLYSLLGSGTAQGSEIVLHVIGENAELERVAGAVGAQVVHVESGFSGEAAYCNKLLQLDTPALRRADMVVLCDTDIAFCENIRGILRSAEAVRAKQVDCANPPLALLQELFCRSGISATPEITPCTFDQGESFTVNCNGGLYVIPGRYLDLLAEKWKKWAQWCLRQKDLLGEFLKHSDQIGFCFAMLELDLPFEPLDERYNFPMHLPLDRLRFYDTAPAVVHYHWLVNEHGFIADIGLPAVDSACKVANSFVVDQRRKNYSNKIFWDFRYRYHSDLGSGVGSRGDNLLKRREIIYPLLERFRRKTVLDVGCGDLEMIRDANLEQYVGVDLSEQALAICREKRPDWTFKNPNDDSIQKKFDLVICSHVLIHQPDIDSYHDLISMLIEKCSDTLLIEAYDEPPVFTSDITYYYEPISKTLKKDKRVTSVVCIGKCRDISILVARVHQGFFSKNVTIIRSLFQKR